MRCKTNIASEDRSGALYVCVWVFYPLPLQIFAFLFVDCRPNNSVALPFLPRPEALDGTMIGDVGFDPLGFATEDNLDR